MKGFFVWLVAAVALGARAADSGTGFAREALQPYVDSGELPGAISVFRRPGAEEVACLGFADLETKRAPTLDSSFMQCSQTKGCCGVSVAMLVESGRLKLDDPVSRYLPEFATLWIRSGETNGVRTSVRAQNKLTVRMCLNHTGGLPFELPNYELMGGWSRRMPLRSVAATAAALPLRFEPGTKVGYSNVGIDIAAAIVEKVSGLRWEDFLRKRIFDPLGMSATGFWPTDRQLEDRIRLYTVKPGQKPVPRIDSAMQPPFGDDRVFPSAGAGLWTTARDQLKFYSMLMNLGVGENGRRILKAETVKGLLAVSSRPKGFEGYSLGLSAPVSDGDAAWFGHGGAFGTNCMVNWHRKELKLWVVQAYGGPFPWEKARAEAAKRFFSRPVDAAGVDAYTGRMK